MCGDLLLESGWVCLAGIWVGSVTAIYVGLALVLESGCGCWLEPGLGLLAEIYVGFVC